jgi:hypothetical protein
LWELAVLYTAVGDARGKNRDAVFRFVFLDTYLGSFGLVCFGLEGSSCVVSLVFCWFELV